MHSRTTHGVILKDSTPNVLSNGSGSRPSHSSHPPPTVSPTKYAAFVCLNYVRIFCGVVLPSKDAHIVRPILFLHVAGQDLTSANNVQSAIKPLPVYQTTLNSHIRSSQVGIIEPCGFHRSTYVGLRSCCQVVAEHRHQRTRHPRLLLQLY